MKNTLKTLLLAAALALPAAAFAQAPQEHSHETPQPPKLKWSFAGPFGKYDPVQLQRGLKVYKDVATGTKADRPHIGPALIERRAAPLRR